MFRPEELQENVVGAVVIDWKKLEDRAKYHEGLLYTTHSQQIYSFDISIHSLMSAK